MVSYKALEIGNEIMNVYPLGTLIREDEIIIAFKMLAVFKIDLYLVLFPAFENWKRGGVNRNNALTVFGFGRLKSLFLFDPDRRFIDGYFLFSKSISDHFKARASPWRNPV